ncbi:MAG: MBL fold metallo-hydrolase, partial [Planctomycetota bacterium]
PGYDPDRYKVCRPLGPDGGGPWEIDLGRVHAWLIADDAGLTLIDAGYPRQAKRICAAIAETGFALSDLRHVVVTHAHPDHTGSLAEIRRRAPEARVYAHPHEAALMAAGRTKRPELRPAPGVMHRALFEAFVRRSPHAVEPVEADLTITDGDELPIAGGLRVVHTPGHAAGHVALHWPAGAGRRGVLVVGDAMMHLVGLDYAICYEDFDAGRASVAKLASLDFDAAVFGHGRAITSNASSVFRRFASRRGLP